MNKRLVVLLILASSICGCVNTSPKANKTQINTEKKVEIVKTVSQILKVAEKNVDKEILIQGRVKHVCEHSGRRCFIIDEEGNSIKIEASGDLKGFNKEISGMTIKIRGILKEQRISKEKIEKIAEEQKLEEEGEHCGTESANILNMRAWMKKYGKDYFAFYYVNGIEYTII